MKKESKSGREEMEIENDNTGNKGEMAPLMFAIKNKRRIVEETKRKTKG